jgi:hypothetical protein
MKTMKSIASLILAAVAFSASALAAEKVVASPKGGRLLETEGQKTEFFVTADKKVEINFYDAASKPVAPGAQVVSISAEPKSGRTKVELEKTATGYVSKTALPASSEPYRIVVQVRSNAEAKPQNFRVDLNLETCGECKHPEYACTCEAH